MFNLFKGGIKGRLFNNPAEGGKGEKKMKKGIVLVMAIVGALVLVGWGCGNGYAVNNEPIVQTYNNEAWGVRFTYPTGWQYHEYRETVEGEELVTLAFSDQELPETLPPEPLFPIMVFRDTGTVESAASGYTDVVSSEDVTLGGRIVKKIIYYSNILEQNDRVYLTPLRDGILKLFVPDGTSHVSTAEAMIANLTETE